jgi:hypothetical protein
MTWKRRLAVIGLFVVLVCVGVGLAKLLTPDQRPSVTKANFDNLLEGMSKEQVEALLGENNRTTFYGGSLHGGGGVQSWRADDGARVDIFFTVQYLDDRPEWKASSSMTWTDSTETTWQRIRRWLRIPA